MILEDNWKKIVVAPNTTIGDALKVIEEGGLRIALVADDVGLFLGTLSDGDVRRALIQRMPLSEPVIKAMNANAHVAFESTGAESVLALMEKNDILVVPVVDGNGRLVGMRSRHQSLELRSNGNAVFLMAGGFGKRLSPLTDDCPKPMLKLGSKPILENTLESFIAAGFTRFFIAVHYLPETIKLHFGNGSRWGVDIRYVEEDVPLGTAGALGLLPHPESLPILVMNGDIVTRVDYRELLAFHTRNEAALTMCVREYDLQVPYGVVQATGHLVQNIVEKPVHKFFVNAGIYVLSPEVVARVPRKSRIDMPDLVRDVVASGENVTMFPIHEYWLDIGQFGDFDRAVVEASLAK